MKSLLKESLRDAIKEANATDSKADNTEASTISKGPVMMDRNLQTFPTEVFFKEFTKEIVRQTEEMLRMCEKVPVKNSKS
jgi:hypothetical protein